MTRSIALFSCITFVVAALIVEAKRNHSSSRILWLPIIYMMLCATARPAAYWVYEILGVGSFSEDSFGSVVDRFLLAAMTILALMFLLKRRANGVGLLKDSGCVLFVYSYLLMTVIWALEPSIAFNRWVRTAIVIVMVLLISSERAPLETLESVFRRCAYILIPFSLVLSKYFPQIGHDYSWDGRMMWVGVAGQKNGLGIICTISLFFLLWSAFHQKRTMGRWFRNRAEFLADAAVGFIALYLLLGGGAGAYSATSIAVLAVSCFGVAVFFLQEGFGRWVFSHLKFTLFFVAVAFLLLKEVLFPLVLPILGRDSSLTGRHDIWDSLLSIASEDPFLGTGFGSFWGLTDDTSITFGVTQAHNGYLETYLQFGIIGLVLLGWLLISYCGKIERLARANYGLGVFSLMLLAMLLIYNYSETAFFNYGYLWNSTMLLYVINGRLAEFNRA